MTIRKEPCDECAFARDCRPGLLGGSDATVYIGQTQGPFQIPCHKATDFRDPHWRDTAFEVIQCAGAAVFRANIGVDHRMPPELEPLPPSASVFSTPAEFLAHHKGIPLEAAETWLRETTPIDYLAIEINKAEVKLRPSKGKP